jgi:putative DNA primase/helicase
LICWPDNQGEWRDVDKFPDSAGKRAAYAVFERLNSLSVASLDSHQDSDFNGAASGLPYLRFAPDALELFQEWRRELEAKMRNDNIGAATEAALSKFRKHVPALALTLHVVDGHSGPVSLTSTVRALTLADYFESHATRAYASAVRPTVTTAKAILRKLKSAALQCQFTARDVYRPGWEGLTDRELVEAALGMLVSHGYLAETEISNGGRPTVVYTLNEGAAL